jgi:hypothetical protein
MNKERDIADALGMALDIGIKLQEKTALMGKLDEFRTAELPPPPQSAEQLAAVQANYDMAMKEYGTPLGYMDVKVQSSLDKRHFSLEHYKRAQRVPEFPDINISPNYGREAMAEIMRELSQRMSPQPCPLANRYNVPSPDKVSEMPEDE